MTKMQKELIKKIKSFKTDEEVRNFLEVYLKLYKNTEENKDKSGPVALGIDQMFRNCANLTSVDLSSLTSVPIGYKP